MAEVVVQVERLSKLYRLGSIGTGSLRQDVQRWWTTNLLGKEDPFFQADSWAAAESGQSKDFLWALRNIDFEVRQGEVMGIIGHNGSGKSTLLKILSRIVRPTSGVVRGKGKVSSLLEVGTGFNPELTGRENIFMSGFILGMKRHEVQKKFDEILAFSGVEKFIDTPVKRYSSGMYMRLAFSVAAHLEPDILIIDEVLAVGDAEFQQKCLGKMEEASQQHGRTIIFVSHDAHAVSTLCTKTLWLESGQVKGLGDTSSVIKSYLAGVQAPTQSSQMWAEAEAAPGNNFFRLKKIKVKPLGAGEENKLITVHTPIQIEAEFWSAAAGCMLEVSMWLLTEKKEWVFDLGTPSIEAKKGIMTFTCNIPANLLNDIKYHISILVLKENGECLTEFPECTSFVVHDFREGMTYLGPWSGVIRPKVDMSISIKPQVQNKAIAYLD